MKPMRSMARLWFEYCCRICEDHDKTAVPKFIRSRMFQMVARFVLRRCTCLLFFVSFSLEGWDSRAHQEHPAMPNVRQA